MRHPAAWANLVMLLGVSQACLSVEEWPEELRYTDQVDNPIPANTDIAFELRLGAIVPGFVELPDAQVAVYPTLKDGLWRIDRMDPLRAEIDQIYEFLEGDEVTNVIGFDEVSRQILIRFNADDKPYVAGINVDTGDFQMIQETATACWQKGEVVACVRRPSLEGGTRESVELQACDGCEVSELGSALVRVFQLGSDNDGVVLGMEAADDTVEIVYIDLNAGEARSLLTVPEWTVRSGFFDANMEVDKLAGRINDSQLGFPLRICNFDGSPCDATFETFGGNNYAIDDEGNNLYAYLPASSDQNLFFSGGSIERLNLRDGEQTTILAATSYPFDITAATLGGQSSAVVTRLASGNGELELLRVPSDGSTETILASGVAAIAGGDAARGLLTYQDFEDSALYEVMIDGSGQTSPPKQIFHGVLINSSVTYSTHDDSYYVLERRVNENPSLTWVNRPVATAAMPEQN